MKVKLGYLFLSVNILNKISKASLPLITSFKIGKFFEKAQKELSLFEQKRIELVRKYAKKDKKGEVIEKDMKVDEKNLEDFSKEFNELGAIESEADFEKLKLSSLVNIELPPSDIGLISEFIEDDLN